MKIAVVVPVWQEAARIDGCLAALETQGFDELVVVDGGSSDDTVAVAAARGHRVITAERSRASQQNAGAAATSSDVVVFVHADVTLPTNARAHIEACLTDGSVVAGAFVTWTIKDDGLPAPWWSPLVHLADLRSRYTRRPYGDQAIFVRRAIFDVVSGFAELPLLEDVDLTERLARHGLIARVAVPVLVSGRRFYARPLFYFVVMNVFPVLFRLGVSAQRLASLYGHIR